MPSLSSPFIHYHFTMKYPKDIKNLEYVPNYTIRGLHVSRRLNISLSWFSRKFIVQFAFNQTIWTHNPPHTISLVDCEFWMMKLTARARTFSFCDADIFYLRFLSLSPFFFSVFSRLRSPKKKPLPPPLPPADSTTLKKDFYWNWTHSCKFSSEQFSVAYRACQMKKFWISIGTGSFQ